MTSNPQDPIREVPVTEIIPPDLPQLARFPLPQPGPNLIQEGWPGRIRNCARRTATIMVPPSLLVALSFFLARGGWNGYAVRLAP